MRNIFSLAAIALSVGLLSTSCLNDDPEYSQEINLNYSGEACFNRVTDLETGETLVSGNPSYLMKFLTEGTKSSMIMEMSNIQLTTGFSGLAFKLPELAYTYNQETGYFVSTGKDIVPLNAGSSYSFDNFTLRFLPTRMINGANCPIYLIDYTVNKQYQVTVIPATPVFFAISTAHPVNGGNDFVHKDPDTYVAFKIDPQKMLGSISMGNTQLGDDMLQNTLIIKDLPVTIEGNTVRMTAPSDEPVVIYGTNNKPFKKSTVSDLAVRFDISSGAGSISGEFLIDDATGTGPDYEPQTYVTVVDLNYFYATDDKN